MGSVTVTIPEWDGDHPVERHVALLGFVGWKAATRIDRGGEDNVTGGTARFSSCASTADTVAGSGSLPQCISTTVGVLPGGAG
jgi:hypothetical protein